MNLAFPALLIFLLVLPGFVFNLSFYQTENVRLKYIPLTHKAILCSVIAVILHGIWLFVFHLFNYNVNINLILILISGVDISSAINTITNNEVFISIVYLFTLYIASYLLGLTLRSCIRRFRLEQYSFFRIESPWYYLFTGSDSNQAQPDGVRIAATIEIAGKCYLYVGWLDKFYLDSNGNIDRLILTSAMRREIGMDKNQQSAVSLVDRFYTIDGHYFVLKYSDIKNLNVQFLQLKPLNIIV